MLAGKAMASNSYVKGLVDRKIVIEDMVKILPLNELYGMKILLIDAKLCVKINETTRKRLLIT